MNLVLLHPEDLLNESEARLTGRRFRHIVEVHRAAEGDALAIGMLGGRIGVGRVIKLGDSALDLDISFDRDPPAPLLFTVVLALPRPKVLRRVLRSLTVLGVKRIVLMNAARVEKSYWQSPFLEREEIRRQLVLGLEQACDTLLPEVLPRPRFKPFVEDELPGMLRDSFALVAHPGSSTPCPREIRRPVTLAIGPEGGFVPYELDMLIAGGFSAVSLGERILNVETAIPALISRLA